MEDLANTFKKMQWLKDPIWQHLEHNIAKQLLSLTQRGQPADRLMVELSAVAATIKALKEQFDLPLAFQEDGIPDPDTAISGFAFNIIREHADDLSQLFNMRRPELVLEVIHTGVEALNPNSSVDDRSMRDIYAYATQAITDAEAGGKMIEGMGRSMVTWRQPKSAEQRGITTISRVRGPWGEDAALPVRYL